MATTQADLQVNNKKMVGSAQLRRQGAVLQHGSILLDQPQNLLPELLDSKHNANAERHSNFKDVAGRDADVDELQNAFTKGFAEAFSADFKAGELIDSEKDLLNGLRANYLH